MTKRGKQCLWALVAIIVGMALCLNEAVYGDHSLGVRIAYGVMAVALYAGVYLLPYFLRKPKHPELTLRSYIKEEIQGFFNHG